jgi:hypothetical protein
MQNLDVQERFGDRKRVYDNEIWAHLGEDLIGKSKWDVEATMGDMTDLICF